MEELNRQNSLDFLEQCEYQKLFQAREYLPTILSQDIKLVEFFQNSERFYDYGQYLWAKNRVDELWQVINAVHFPYEYGFNKASHFIAPWDWDSLVEYWQKQSSPFAELYPKLLQHPEEWNTIGISLTFISQIPEAFYICQWLREVAPKSFIILGGAAIHQIFIHGKDVAKKILRVVDGIGLYEGEELLSSLLPIIPEWQKATDLNIKFELLKDVPNLLTYSPKDELRQGALKVTDLTKSSLPDYSDLDLDRYLAPSRTLLYAPTRGCYWNKCSFCEYGFSQSGSHCYREIPAEEAVSQLAKLSRKYGVKNYYISCDVLAPNYALAMAELIQERKLNIRWNCDLRIEKYYTLERCQKLYQGGFRAVAFGIESGSDRVLQLMNKGISVAQIEEINENFHKAGIATAWMCFQYHPGETFEEAMATVEMIERQQHLVDLFIVGEFDMTPGSKIAHCPKEYGIKIIYHAAGDEFKLFPMYDGKYKNIHGAMRAKLDQAIARLAQSYNFQKYPWAGSISTHHTLLYFLRYGQRAFAGTLHRKASGFSYTPAEQLHGMGITNKFSLRLVDSNINKFWEKYQKIVFTYNENNICPLSIQHFTQEVQDLPVLSKGKGTGPKNSPDQGSTPRRRR